MALMSNLPALGEGEEVDPQATALAYFIDKGYTPQQAAGIVGNLIQESGSGLNTTAVHDGGTGFGIAGFRDPTPGQGRKTNLLNFAKGSSADPRDLFTQLDFVHKELQGSEGAANRNLLRASDPASAATAFAGYERPQGWSAANPMGAHGIQNRIDNAQALAPLAGQLASAGEGQEIEVNDAPVGGRAFAAGKGIMGGSGMISGTAGSDTMTGSGGSDRFSGGLMNKPYQPGDQGDDVGSVLGAIGQALLSGTRQNPMANLPKILQAQQEAANRREDRRYGMYKDQRNFDVGRQDAAQSQANTDRSFGLQGRQVDNAEANTKFTQGIQTSQEARAAADANKPKVMADSSGGIVAVSPDGASIKTLAPGQKVLTESGKVEERKAILRSQGKDPDAPENQPFVLNGKMPDSKAPTVQKIKQADGSEISVQWDDAKNAWVPMVAPEGGNAVRPTGKAMTEAQGKDVVFFDRGAAAHDTLNKHGDALKSGVQRGLGDVPRVGNYMTSEDYKLGKNAEELFLSAFLRKESGAAIGPSEFNMYGRMFIPQPGDPDSVVKQKAENRRIGLASIKEGLPPAVAMTRVTEANPEKVTTQEQYNNLAPGAAYIDPFGKKRVKGGAQ